MHPVTEYKYAVAPLQRCLGEFAPEDLLWNSICCPATICVMFVQLSFAVWQSAFSDWPCSTLQYPAVLPAWCTSHFYSYSVHNSSHLRCYSLLSIYFDVSVVSNWAVFKTLNLSQPCKRHHREFGLSEKGFWILGLLYLAMAQHDLIEKQQNRLIATVSSVTLPVTGTRMFTVG